MVNDFCSSKPSYFFEFLAFLVYSIRLSTCSIKFHKKIIFWKSRWKANIRYFSSFCCEKSSAIIHECYQRFILIYVHKFFSYNSSGYTINCSLPSQLTVPVDNPVQFWKSPLHQILFKPQLHVPFFPSYLCRLH